MIASLAFIFLFGLAAAALCHKIRLPRIVGMLCIGIVLGPFVLNLLHPSILGISSELREIALVIILIKAGLSLNIADLKEVGRPAILLSFMPALFEIGAVVLIGPVLLHLTLLESAILGAVLGAVSPAVVVPRMVSLMENGYGTDKKIPQMILAGSSLDDVFVIVLFTTFLGMAQGSSVSMMSLIQIPVSIFLGIIGGGFTGFLLSVWFETRYAKKHYVRNSMKTIVLLGISFLLLALEDWLSGVVPFSGLLAIMSAACMVQRKAARVVSKRLSEKFGKLWLAAEVLLFVLVGAAVDIRYTLVAGLPALAMIAIALCFRSVGVLLCLIRTNLTYRERLFCVISYLPKATVQAAIGSIPLAMGLPCGNLVLSVSVLSILTTAPLGSFGMDLSYQKLLHHSEKAE